MSNNVSVKTNFTAGQVSPLIYGRGDLGIFENGARTLENVIIPPTGGISRRRGLRCIDKISGRIQMRLAKRNRDKVRLFSNSDTSAVFMQIVISALCRHADDFRCWHNGRLADADTASDIHHGAENLHLIP